MTSRLAGRPSVVLRLSGREDGSVIKLFRRAVMTLATRLDVTHAELYRFVQEADQHWDSWENMMDYCREWMVVE